jgi:hypothetical protein
VVVALVLIALYAAYRYTLHRIVQARLDEIRKQGYPVTLAELDKWYPQVPPGENAADVYLEAFKHFAPNQKGDTNLPVVGYAKLPPRGAAMNESMKQAVSEYLARNEPALMLLHNAAKVKQSRYPVYLADTSGSTSAMRYYSGVRQGTRLLVLEAILRAQSGLAQQAVDSVSANFSLAGSLKEEPLIVSQFTRLACLAVAIDSLEQVVNIAPLSADHLQQLAAGLTEAEMPDAIFRSFVGEMCSAKSLFEKPLGDQLTAMSSDSDPVPVLFVYQYAGIRQMDYLAFSEVLESYRAACQSPFPVRLQLARATKLRAERESRWHLVSRSFGPVLEAVVESEAKKIALVRTACAAITVEEYRLANGKLPDRPGEPATGSSAAAFSDPFDGQPLRYKKLAKGYVVYSIGKDGIDNGGTEGYCPGTDITFTVER